MAQILPGITIDLTRQFWTDLEFNFLFVHDRPQIGLEIIYFRTWLCCYHGARSRQHKRDKRADKNTWMVHTILSKKGL